MQKTAAQQRRLDLFEAREKIMAIEGLTIQQQRQMLDVLYAFVGQGGKAIKGRRHTIAVYLN